MTRLSFSRFLSFCVLAVTISISFGTAMTAPASEKEHVDAKKTAEESEGTTEILTSLLELRKNLQEQMQISRSKLAKVTSETEKTAVQAELAHIDQQLSENKYDFERIATGIEPNLFTDKPPEQFSWQKELSSLLEPAIKELKRFTVRARHKTDLKDKISELEGLLDAATKGVDQLHLVAENTSDKQVKREVSALQPEWKNEVKRLQNKLDLANRELAQLEAQDVSLVETSSRSVADFFRNRGFYLLVALLTFLAILLFFRLLYILFTKLSARITKQPEERSLQARLLYLVFQVLSIVFAITGLFFVLYLAEDWFLLSMTIVFFLGLAWTIRQGIPRLWQQGRLMLNVGSVRENERIILHGVPWRVTSINVFCNLTNPALGVTLRVPIEDLIGKSSRPWSHEEPWFPCRKGDWVEIGDASRAKVVSLSHEQVEMVERGGRHIYYPTEAFLAACPANISRNFRLRVSFGLSYGLQNKITQDIPATLKEYIVNKMEKEGIQQHCHNLLVEFASAGSSSLDLLIIADFSGKVADIKTRLERSIQRWCVDCSTENNWEIPFPQLTIHKG